jgi:D-apionate oxidoisomerase
LRSNDVTKIALLGAGGKMGVRLSTNLKDTLFDVDHVEVSAEGRARLKTALGIECMEQIRRFRPPTRCHGGARPADREDPQDVRQGARPGAKVVVLDAAAPHDGELPERGHHLFRDTSVPPAHLQ